MYDVFVIDRQTILHLPNPVQLYGHSISGSLQLGDASIIANHTGITTVGDFRAADMALGGEGAPLVPYLDYILLKRHFIKTKRVGVFLNVGGISNIFSGSPYRGAIYFKILTINHNRMYRNEEC